MLDLDLTIAAYCLVSILITMGGECMCCGCAGLMFTGGTPLTAQVEFTADPVVPGDAFYTFVPVCCEDGSLVDLAEGDVDVNVASLWSAEGHDPATIDCYFGGSVTSDCDFDEYEGGVYKRTRTGSGTKTVIVGVFHDTAGGHDWLAVIDTTTEEYGSGMSAFTAIETSGSLCDLGAAPADVLTGTPTYDADMSGSGDAYYSNSVSWGGGSPTAFGCFAHGTGQSHVTFAA